MTAKREALLVGTTITVVGIALDAVTQRQGLTLLDVLSSLAAGTFAGWLLYRRGPTPSPPPPPPR